MDFLTMYKYGSEKMLLAVPACFFALEMQHKEILAGIVFVVILDTMAGAFVGFKFRRFCSPILRRMVSKSAHYGLAMASVWILVAIEPMFWWAFYLMGIFIILTEILSVFEKLALLGMKLPTKLIARINKQYDALLDGKGNPETLMNKRDLLP